MALLCFSDILLKCGIDPSKVKLIRHSLTDKGFKKCYDAKMVYEYTRHQKTGFSASYDYWAVFIGDVGTYAKFFALYRVDGFVPDTPDIAPFGIPKPEADNYCGENAYFHLVHVDLLLEYENKLVIDWGSSPRMWHQKGTTEKAIISLLPDAQKMFSGFEDLVLSFDQLKEIVDNRHIYESWHIALASIYAIYLITDRKNGQQYVGSAYGNDGLLGRWSCYVETHHGGNKRMKDLLDKQPERYHDFQFSILQIIPKTATVDDVISIEKRYKHKLLSIEFGLNDN